MGGVALTAYYCCGARMADARRAHPVCGDRYAERFMDDEARALFRRFEGMTGPNATNATRHRIIDDLLRERLAANPRQHVVLLGAGFDTRAFRLHGGHWLELDDPALIARKQDLLPAAQAPNPLARVAIDFATDRLDDCLAPWQGQQGTVVVLEGVSMYLAPAALQATLAALLLRLPRHALVCDLQTARFMRRYGRTMRARLAELGARLGPLSDRPEQPVLEMGYRLADRQSIIARAIELGAMRGPPLWFFNRFMTTLRDGYQVMVFDAPETVPAPAGAPGST